MFYLQILIIYIIEEEERVADLDNECDESKAEFPLVNFRMSTAEEEVETWITNFEIIQKQFFFFSKSLVEFIPELVILSISILCETQFIIYHKYIFMVRFLLWLSDT